MMTVKEIISYLEMELADAYEQYDLAKGNDARQAMVHLVRATTIQNLLDWIRTDKTKN